MMASTPHSVRHIPGEAPDEIGYVVDAARSQVEQELQISQRLDTKMQYQFAVTAGWFVATQAFAAAVLNQAGVDDGWIVGVLVAALAATVVFSAATYRSFEMWKLRPDKGLDPQKLKTWADRVHQRDPVVPGEIAKEYAALLEVRRDNNAKRATALRNSFEACAWAVGLTAAELVVSLGARLLGT